MKNLEYADYQNQMIVIFEFFLRKVRKFIFFFVTLPIIGSIIDN